MFDKTIRECVYCKEAKLNVGERTEYGAIVVYKDSDEKNGWFATLSPKTLGDVKKDFTIQIMPRVHINHLSGLGDSEELAKNYGLIFSQVGKAITGIMKEEKRHKENDENIARVGLYGKSKHSEEHFHVKLFPWEHPYVVDSTYENKEIHSDKEGNKFVKMTPIKKMMIGEERLNYLAERLINIINNQNDRR